MQNFFKELFEYNHRVNQKLADVFIEHPDKTSEKAIKLYSHILNAHTIWNSRIELKKTAAGVWDLQTIQALKSIDQTNYECTLQLLDKLESSPTINYTNSKGQAFSSTVRDILFHVINHSTYHRGQIASDFKQHGLEPLITDYIFFKR